MRILTAGKEVGGRKFNRFTASEAENVKTQKPMNVKLKSPVSKPFLRSSAISDPTAEKKEETDDRCGFLRILCLHESIVKVQAGKNVRILKSMKLST